MPKRTIPLSQVTADDIDPEVCKQYADKWLQNALRTDQMTKEDFEVCPTHVVNMYKIADLDPPKHITYIKSPLALAVAGSISACLWYLDENYAGVCEGRENLSESEQIRRVRLAVPELVREALKCDPWEDKQNSVFISCMRAIMETCPPKFYGADEIAFIRPLETEVVYDSYKLVDLAKLFPNEPAEVIDDLENIFAAGFKCCAQHYDMWQGGNQWSAGCSFLDYWTEEFGATLDGKDVFSDFRELALRSGARIVHQDFVIISDRPDRLCLDEQYRPHSTDGPSHRWTDGWSMWYIDGLAVDEQIVMRPETQTIDQIDGEQNNDIRSIRIDRFGWDRYLIESGAEEIDVDRDAVSGTYQALYRTKRDENRLIVACPTARMFSLGIPATVRTCQEAQKWLAGDEKINIIGAT